MEIKEIKDAIDEASKSLKEGVEGAKGQAAEALKKASEFMTSLEGKADKSEVETLIKSLEEKLKATQDHADQLDVKLQKAQSTKETEKKSFVDALGDALAEKKEEIDGILAKGGKQSGPLMLNVKAAVTMGDYNTIEAVGSASHYTLTSNTGIISQIRKRILRYLSNVSIGGLSIDKPYAMWIEELDEQGTPIFIGEGDAKTQLSVRYEEREKKAKKIGVYGKVTTEMLRYLPQLISYIQNNLVKRMDIATEDQLFSGDDTGDNLAGVEGYATAFAAGSAAGTIDNANEFDVLNAIATQVEVAHGISNIVFIHPRTMQSMKAIKSTTGEPLYKDYMDILGSGDMVVSGQKIVSSTMVTEGEFVGGDFSVVHVGFTDNASIQIGLDGNDFTNNKKTILVEQELVQFVSANDTQCLVKGDFATAIAALQSA